MNRKKLIITSVIMSILISPIIILADNDDIIKINTESTIVNQEHEFFLTGEEIEMNYKIMPQSIEVSDVYNNVKKKKEIALVMDYSGSMNEYTTYEKKYQEEYYVEGNYIINSINIKNNNNHNQDKLLKHEVSHIRENEEIIENVYLMYSTNDSIEYIGNYITSIENIARDLDGKYTLYKENNKNKKYSINYSNKQKGIFGEDFNNNEVFYAYILATDKKGNILQLTKSKYPIRYDGSNNIRYTKAEAMIDTTKNFIEKFRGNEDVYISTIPYATKAEILDESVNMNNYNAIGTMIENIETYSFNGGTNIGDGLRRAYNMLMNSENDSSLKYIILLTDGQATQYSVIKKGNRYYYYKGEGEAHYYLPGTYNDYERGQRYSEIIGEELLENNQRVFSYMVGFGSSTNKDKLKHLANISGGQYKYADDGNALDDIYQEIGNLIESTLLTSKININLRIPQGVDIIEEDLEEGLKVVAKGNQRYIEGVLTTPMTYTLSEDKQTYVAEPIEFNIKYIANKAGIYELSGEDMEISFKGLKDDIHNYSFPSKKVTVEEAISNITINKTGLFMNGEVVEVNNPVNLAIDNNYEYAVEFTSNNINYRNTTIDISINPNSNNVMINSYKLYKYEGYKLVLINEGFKTTDKNTLIPNIRERAKSNKYLLVYKIRGNKVENIKENIVFNNSNTKKTQDIKFVPWPNID